MEELISSMNRNVHVGRQGYELSALQVSFGSSNKQAAILMSINTPQDQLSKTLACNVNPYTILQRTPFDASPMDMRPSDASFTQAQTAKPVRPTVTPTTSFRGSSGWSASNESWNHGTPTDTRNHQVDMQSQSSGLSNSSVRSTSRARRDHAESPTHKPDDYSAFQEDAFAPLHSERSTSQHLFNGTADPWAGFRSKVPPAAFHSSHQQAWVQTTPQPASWQQPAFANNTSANY